MFNRVLSLVALALVASSTFAMPQSSSESQCDNPSGIQCCESMVRSHSREGRAILNAINRRDVPDNVMIARGCGGGITNTGGGGKWYVRAALCRNLR